MSLSNYARLLCPHTTHSNGVLLSLEHQQRREREGPTVIHGYETIKLEVPAGKKRLLGTGENRQEESCSQLLRSCPMSHTHTHGYVWRHGRKRMSGKVKTPGGESIYPIPTVQTNHNHLSFLIYWNTTCNGGFGEHLPMFESCCKNSWLNTWLLFSKKFPDIRSQFNHI